MRKLYQILYQICIYARSTCVHALFAMDIFHYIPVENFQPEWSLAWMQCSLAFLICAMCARA